MEPQLDKYCNKIHSRKMTLEGIFSHIFPHLRTYPPGIGPHTHRCLTLLVDCILPAPRIFLQSPLIRLRIPNSSLCCGIIRILTGMTRMFCCRCGGRYLLGILRHISCSVWKLGFRIECLRLMNWCNLQSHCPWIHQDIFRTCTFRC